jgi:hypothetical protein
MSYHRNTVFDQIMDHINLVLTEGINYHKIFRNP